MFKIEDNQLVKCQETTLDPEKNYIIIDKHIKRPKIWVWRGPNSSAKERYFVGVSATVIKTQEGLYGSSIEVIEGGSEPEQFPKLDETQFIEPSEEDFNKISSRLKIQSSESAETEMEQVKETIENEVEPIKAESAKKPRKRIDIKLDEEEVVAPHGSIIRDAREAKSQKVSKPFSESDSSGDIVLKQKLKSFLHNMSKSLEQLQSKIDKFLEEL
jgi:chaperonin cofactor prefoldin